MIIVGTHLDKVAEQEAKRLKDLALEKYTDTSFYPRIVSVEIVSSVKQRGFFATKYIEKLQRVIYDAACHLQVSKDEGTCTLGNKTTLYLYTSLYVVHGCDTCIWL